MFAKFCFVHRKWWIQLWRHYSNFIWMIKYPNAHNQYFGFLYSLLLRIWISCDHGSILMKTYQLDVFLSKVIYMFFVENRSYTHKCGSYYGNSTIDEYVLYLYYPNFMNKNKMWFLWYLMFFSEIVLWVFPFFVFFESCKQP